MPHERLNIILNAHGIRGKFSLWIKDWLSGRQQRVVLNGEKSTWRSVLSGVPQGSVLGPILFVIFINFFDRYILNEVHILSKFADDTKIGRIVNNVNDSTILQNAIDKVVLWSEEWQMKYNTDKCKVLHFGRSNEKNLLQNEW